MSIVTSILRPLFDALLYPFHALHPMVGLAVASLVVTVLVLVVLKLVSNQEKIEQVKATLPATIGEVDGVRLLDEDAMNAARTQRSQGDDLTLVDLQAEAPEHLLVPEGLGEVLHLDSVGKSGSKHNPSADIIAVKTIRVQREQQAF